MHVCSLSYIFSEEETSLLGDVAEEALASAQELLEEQEKDLPPFYDSQTTSEAAQEYINLVATQQRKVQALERFVHLLQSC